MAAAPVAAGMGAANAEPREMQRPAADAGEAA
jgi:hypothetical protein